MSRTVYQFANATMPPATIGAAASLLTNCDPTLEGLLDGFEWAIDHFLGAAWTNACVGFGGNKIVGATYSVDPIDEIARATWTWPALIGWRGDSRFGKRTIHFDDHECDIHVVYALPPLSLEFLLRLSHVRVAVMRVCRMFIEEHGHLAYTAGGDNWLETLNVDSISLVDAEEGDAFPPMNSAQRHVGLKMRFVLKEREMLYDADMTDRTYAVSTIVHDDLVSEQLDGVVVYSGGALPTVAIEIPAASFIMAEDDTLTVSGTATDSTVVEIWMRVNRGVWYSLGRVAVVAGAFTVSRLLTADDVGAVDLKAIAEGPGGETTSDEIAGTVTA